VLAQFGGHQGGKFFVGEIAAHSSLPLLAGFFRSDRRGD
jgi:hypothetical protein